MGVSVLTEQRPNPKNTRTQEHKNGRTQDHKKGRTEEPDASWILGEGSQIR